MMLKKDKSLFAKLMQIFSIVGVLGLSIPAMSHQTIADKVDILSEQESEEAIKELNNKLDAAGDSSEKIQILWSAYLKDPFPGVMTHADHDKLMAAIKDAYRTDKRSWGAYFKSMLPAVVGGKKSNPEMVHDHHKIVKEEKKKLPADEGSAPTGANGSQTEAIKKDIEPTKSGSNYRSHQHSIQNTKNAMKVMDLSKSTEALGE